MTLDQYIDLAIKYSRLTSDRDLDRRLGFTGTNVNHWRTKRTWPSDEAMIALAGLAGIDPSTALIDLNIWRSKSEKAKGHYRALLEKVTAAVFIVIVGLSALPIDTAARERDGYRSAPAFPQLYIMRQFAAALARYFRRLFAGLSGCCATI
jgi:hypothetical protein